MKTLVSFLFFPFHIFLEEKFYRSTFVGSFSTVILLPLAIITLGTIHFQQSLVTPYMNATSLNTLSTNSFPTVNIPIKCLNSFGCIVVSYCDQKIKFQFIKYGLVANIGACIVSSGSQIITILNNSVTCDTKEAFNCKGCRNTGGILSCPCEHTVATCTIGGVQGVYAHNNILPTEGVPYQILQADLTTPLFPKTSSSSLVQLSATYVDTSAAVFSYNLISLQSSTMEFPFVDAITDPCNPDGGCENILVMIKDYNSSPELFNCYYVGMRLDLSVMCQWDEVSLTKFILPVKSKLYSSQIFLGKYLTHLLVF